MNEGSDVSEALKVINSIKNLLPREISIEQGADSLMLVHRGEKVGMMSHRVT